MLVVIAAFGLAGTAGGTTHDNYDVPGARAQVGVEQLRDHLPGGGGTSAQVVVHDPRGDVLPRADLAAAGDRMTALDHVGTVSAPRLSADGDTALYYLTYDVPVTDPDMVKERSVDPLEEALEPLRTEGLQVELGGELPNSVITTLKGTGELAGVVAALALLVLTFGSVVAAGLPLVVALIGLAVGSAGVTLLAATMDVSTSAPTIATMVGLGVGIDYALLLVTRHVEFLRSGMDKHEAAGRAMATAGRSVVFAAATVLISLLGLRLAGLPVYSSFGYATAIAVIAVLGSALTLVPALCGLAGRRMLSRKVRTGRTPEHGRTPLAARWAAGVARRPVAAVLLAVIFLLTLAAPSLAMRTWPQDGRSNPSDSTLRRSYDLVEAEYGAGANGTFTVVVDNARADARAVARQVADEAGIVGVTEPVATPDGALSVFDAQPEIGPTDEGIAALVAELRDDLPAGVEITGTTPFFSDITGMLSERLWIVVGFVVGVSVLLLAMMFRSVVVPIKAAVMNLLSIAASYGILVAVFQWGWGTSLLGIDHAVPVSSWVPILNFAILFGLSMDYEVFLLSRIREDWLRTGDAKGSVERGLAATGRVISAAAAIMIVVFLGFATEAELTVKMLGFGMATAILLDATVVRMVLVPATMTLLGKWNWWLPAWLDRLLPTIAAEQHVTDDELWGELDGARDGSEDERVGA